MVVLFFLPEYLNKILNYTFQRFQKSSKKMMHKIFDELKQIALEKFSLLNPSLLKCSNNK